MTDFLDLLTSMTLNDLEPQKGVLVNFSQFLDAEHSLTVNCDEMAGGKPRQPACEIFSTKHRFQQSNPDPLGSEPAQVGLKDGNLPPP